MYTLEILMSAMYQKDMSIAENCNADTDVLIINQCDKNDYAEKVYNGHRIRMISTTERGLSKSRNMALKNARGDICIFCDDDVIYNTGYKESVLNAFNEKKDADIIIINIFIKNKDRRHIMSKKFKKTPRFKRYGSPRIAMKRENILKKDIWFNELFGTGSGKITCGEDALWQNSALKAGLKIYQHPFCIASVAQSKSTWFEGYNAKYFYNMGAYVATAMPLWKHIFKFYYVYRLNNVSELSIKEQLKWLDAGIKGIKDGKSYEEYKEIS